MGPVGSALATLADRFTTEDQINQLEAFKTSTPALSPDNVRRIENAIVTAKTNIQWDEARLGEVKTWVIKRYSGSAISISINLLVAIFAIVMNFIF